MSDCGSHPSNPLDSYEVRTAFESFEPLCDVLVDRRRRTWRACDIVYDLDNPLKFADLKSKRMEKILTHWTGILAVVSRTIFSADRGGRMNLAPDGARRHGVTPGKCLGRQES